MSRVMIAAIALGLLLSGCEGEPNEAEPSVPADLQVPSGVTLTSPGTSLKFTERAAAVFTVDDRTSTVVQVRPLTLKKGSMADFSTFSLDNDVKKTRIPYYLTIEVHNAGPAGAGGSSVPMYINTGKGVIVPPNDIVGVFKPCRERQLPNSFLPGDTTKNCLVFLIPKAEKPVSFDLAASDEDPISWRAPKANTKPKD